MSKPFSHGIFLKVPYTETEEITKETGKKKNMHASLERRTCGGQLD